MLYCDVYYNITCMLLRVNPTGLYIIIMKKSWQFPSWIKHKTTNDEWKKVKNKIKNVRRINHYRISKPDREGVTGFPCGKGGSWQAAVMTDKTFYYIIYYNPCKLVNFKCVTYTDEQQSNITVSINNKYILFWNVCVNSESKTGNSHRLQRLQYY